MQAAIFVLEFEEENKLAHFDLGVAALAVRGRIIYEVFVETERKKYCHAVLNQASSFAPYFLECVI